MATRPIEPEERGGFRKPVSIEEFVTEHLREVGEDFASSIHRAYKTKLASLRLPVSRRGMPYKACTYYSFTRELQKMELAGIIAESEKVEYSDNPHTAHWPVKPRRKYYRLREGV